MFRPKCISRSRAKGAVCRVAATNAAASRCRQGVCRVGLGRSGGRKPLRLAGRGRCNGLPVRQPAVMGRASVRARVHASILPAAFATGAGLLEDVTVFQADGGEAAAPDAAGVEGDEVGLQSQAQG